MPEPTATTAATTAASVQATVTGWAESFRADALAAADARAVLTAATAIEHAAAAVKALAAKALADQGAARREGDRSAAHLLARVSGSSVGEAQSALAAATGLTELTATGEAARQGRISLRQASLITDAAAANPACEAELLQLAASGSLGELAAECGRRRAAADPDPAATRDRIHRRRYLRTFNDPEGAWNLSARAPTDVGAQIMAALAPFSDEQFHLARRAGRREPLEAYQLDALAVMAEVASAAGVGVGVDTGAGAGASEDRPPPPVEDRPQSPDRGRQAPPRGESLSPQGGQPSSRGQQALPRRRPPVKLIVRVDLEALVRGRAADGETCEIAGFGPVPVSVVNEMLASDNPFLAAVVTKGKAVTGVVHLGRRPTAFQMTALEWQSPTCAVLGCSQSVRLEVDHVEDWAETHVTRIEALEHKCPYHHWLKTTQGWALIAGVGKRPMVPPTDPRHPKNTAQSTRTDKRQRAIPPEKDSRKEKGAGSSHPGRSGPSSRSGPSDRGAAGGRSVPSGRGAAGGRSPPRR